MTDRILDAEELLERIQRMNARAMGQPFGAVIQARDESFDSSLAPGDLVVSCPRDPEDERIHTSRQVWRELESRGAVEKADPYNYLLREFG